MSMLNDLEAADEAVRPLLNDKKIKSMKNKSKSSRRGGARHDSSSADVSKDRPYPVSTAGGETGVQANANQGNSLF